MCHGRYGYAGRYFRQQPPVNITESDSSYTINLFAPSLSKEHISISTQHDILYVKYKTEEKADEQFTRREYRTHEIDRSFDLKGKVDVDKIKATYRDGVLILELPKTDAAKRPAQEVRIN